MSEVTSSEHSSAFWNQCLLERRQFEFRLLLLGSTCASGVRLACDPFGTPCLLRLLTAGAWCRQAVPTSPPGVAVRERPERRPVLFFEEALTKSTEETSREPEASRRVWPS